MTSLVTERDPSPFHSGERQVQTLAGVRAEAEKRGRRMLSADLNTQQAQFFGQLPFLVCAHLDEAGQPWAGLITGQPGFAGMDPDSGDFHLDWRRARNTTASAPGQDTGLGLLGIELATRRRNRLNGTVLAAGAEKWRIRVDQGYGNCPKYITERAWPAALFNGPYTMAQHDGIDVKSLALAATTDTFFIATASGPQCDDGTTATGAWGADISHRGGEPGFLRQDRGQLAFSDFPGNNMFNTLGNIARYDRCGILLLDFQTGDIAQLAAHGRIESLDGERTVLLDVDASRYWTRLP